jgi:peptidoglycan/LPS O-acetylase OafA/YrhL
MQEPESLWTRRGDCGLAPDMTPPSSASAGRGDASPSPGGEPPLFGIQALRAVAALMVAVHHAQHDAIVVAAKAGGSFAYSGILPWMAGVDIFFVVSGFIMVHASAGLFGRPDGARLFLGRRLARIVPLYWAATTLFLLIGLVLPSALNSGVPDLAQIAGSYLFWPVVSTVGRAQPVFSLGWTLNYEMLFYGLFALGLLLPGRLGLALVTLLLAGLVAAEELAGPLPLPFGFWGQPIVLEFAAGMGIALLRRAGLNLAMPWRGLLAGLGLAMLAAAGDAEAAVVWSSVLPRGAAAALLVLAAGCGGRRAAPPSTPTRILAVLGDASYALYLVHPFVIRGLREVAVRLGFGQPALFIAAALTGAVLAALVVHRLFEKPATAGLRRLLRA